MLQVKYGAKCQTNPLPSPSGRSVHLPTITSGSSARRARRTRWWRSTRARRRRSPRSLRAPGKLSGHSAHSPSSRSYWRGARAARRKSVPVYGPKDSRIPQPIRALGDGDRCELPDLGLSFDILHVPGHTLSHIAFWGHGALFCGDTLFSAGCGRMFEGTPLQMNASLNRLRDLPPETRMYCGHEYTAANLRFALTVEPDNAAALNIRQRSRGCGPTTRRPSHPGCRSRPG